MLEEELCDTLEAEPNNSARHWRLTRQLAGKAGGNLRGAMHDLTFTKTEWEWGLGRNGMEGGVSAISVNIMDEVAQRETRTSGRPIGGWDVQALGSNTLMNPEGPAIPIQFQFGHLLGEECEVSNPDEQKIKTTAAASPTNGRERTERASNTTTIGGNTVATNTATIGGITVASGHGCCSVHGSKARMHHSCQRSTKQRRHLHGSSNPFNATQHGLKRNMANNNSQQPCNAHK